MVHERHRHGAVRQPHASSVLTAPSRSARTARQAGTAHRAGAVAVAAIEAASSPPSVTRQPRPTRTARSSSRTTRCRRRGLPRRTSWWRPTVVTVRATSPTMGSPRTRRRHPHRGRPANPVRPTRHRSGHPAGGSTRRRAGSGRRHRRAVVRVQRHQPDPPGCERRIAGGGNCVNGLGGTLFGQFAYCNAGAFFQLANSEIAANKLQVPASRRPRRPAMPDRTDFSVIDQDQSDNVTTHYLATANGRTGQANAATRARWTTNR